jgi:hypothetical protein
MSLWANVCAHLPLVVWYCQGLLTPGDLPIEARVEMIDAVQRYEG